MSRTRTALWHWLYWVWSMYLCHLFFSWLLLIFGACCYVQKSTGMIAAFWYNWLFCHVFLSYSLAHCCLKFSSFGIIYILQTNYSQEVQNWLCLVPYYVPPSFSVHLCWYRDIRTSLLIAKTWYTSLKLRYLSYCGNVGSNEKHSNMQCSNYITEMLDLAT